MPNISEIIQTIEQEFDLNGFQDSSLNGLQLEGTQEINSLAVAVDSGLSVVEEAIKLKVQLLLVHHGLIWNKPYPLVGPRGEIIRKLFAAEINLLAIHLPLDAHRVYGNNFALARLLSLSNPEPAAPYHGVCVGCTAENSQAETLDEICQRLSQLPGGAQFPLLSLPFGPSIPKRICIVSGAGADALYEFSSGKFDTFITGEPRQFAFHFAKENKLNVIFAGHYATETVGVCELGKMLSEKFVIPWHFIDQPTGI